MNSWKRIALVLELEGLLPDFEVSCVLVDGANGSVVIRGPSTPTSDTPPFQHVSVNLSKLSTRDQLRALAQEIFAEGFGSPTGLL